MVTVAGKPHLKGCGNARLVYFYGRNPDARFFTTTQTAPGTPPGAGKVQDQGIRNKIYRDFTSVGVAGYLTFCLQMNVFDIEEIWEILGRVLLTRSPSGCHRR
jgi:hypothetical protein